MLMRCVALVAAFACAGCGNKLPLQVRTILVSPKTFTISSGQSIDIEVTLVGLPIGTTFACRVQPGTSGLVAVTPTGCRFTASSPVLPGALVIATTGGLADTATVVIPAS